MREDAVWSEYDSCYYRNNDDTIYLEDIGQYAQCESKGVVYDAVHGEYITQNNAVHCAYNEGWIWNKYAIDIPVMTEDLTSIKTIWVNADDEAAWMEDKTEVQFNHSLVCLPKDRLQEFQEKVKTIANPENLPA